MDLGIITKVSSTLFYFHLLRTTICDRPSTNQSAITEIVQLLQVHLPRNQLYVSRVSPKMNLGEILEEVCREKNLDKNKYELRHPGTELKIFYNQDYSKLKGKGKKQGMPIFTDSVIFCWRKLWPQNCRITKYYKVKIKCRVNSGKSVIVLEFV